jgi:DNA repair exonuclease SbcCD ATPase subunit
MSAQDWLTRVGNELAARRNTRDSILNLRDSASRELTELTETATSLEAVDTQVKALALLCQHNCKSSIEELVTRCLDAVFPENRYKFNLVFEKKRDQTEARIVLTDGAGNEYDPLRNNGGGVADVIAFALRLATLMLRVPQPAKVLVLDEPFRCVSENHRQRIADLLFSLASELGFQIIMVTHMRELARGNVIEL